MNVSYDFGGKAAFVTGAAKGMGLAAAEAFVTAAAAVAMFDRDGAALEEQAERLSANGARDSDRR